MQKRFIVGVVLCLMSAGCLTACHLHLHVGEKHEYKMPNSKQSRLDELMDDLEIANSVSR